ncbi:DUF664 domain-containing protein [Deinococcus hopiensis]|uniref:Uncharacterized protein n=1 Tax=Deinococcus hopiensis KR-140 TaxID=695939 RepID=A0A1W1VET2_9DEIO|nr:DUF664 domain-containing protein [Deinococcus hopiensis]SMB91464.1 Protein of unknown function [Deinococcus hopiensis KR-140]
MTLTQPGRTEDKTRWYGIAPEAPFTPHIGALVDVPTYTRTALHADGDLTVERLGATPPRSRNSTGMLLARIAAVEQEDQHPSFKGRDERDVPGFTPYRAWPTLGEEGEPVRGQPLDPYPHGLETAWAKAPSTLPTKGGAWPAPHLTVPDFGNTHHRAWFHVMKDEAGYRGQMRLIRNIAVPEEKV